MAGISFLARIRDEEATLYESINSLKELTIPHEIIIVLHLCTDRSAEIAEQLRAENPNIRVYTYGEKLSRAGYENMATPKNSKHSFVEYSNWCFRKATLPWVFKWDGDFIATPELITYLNANTWTNTNKRIRIAAVNSTHRNAECYLVSGQFGYGKHLFWEVPVFSAGETITVDDTITIYHKSELTEIKKYWTEAPWYETETSKEASLVSQRIRQLETEFGKEPAGAARGSNEVGNKLHHMVLISANRKMYDTW